MDYFIYHAGEQIGPISASEVQGSLADGRFSSSDLGWHEGLVEWTPLSALFPREGCSSPPPIPQTQPDQADVPADVMHGIRALAQRDHPGDYTTQKYIIETQRESYLALRLLSAPDVPHDIFSGICAMAVADHPGDYTTQKYIIETQLQAYRDLYCS